MSFTRAASELCITQGAVSQQVKQLEDWVGRALFLRSPRALVLTPEGQWLAAVVGESFQAMEGTLAQLRMARGGGPLALSCAPSFAMGWLTPRLGDFYRRHPDVELRVIGEFQALDRARMAGDERAAEVRYDLGVYPDLQATEFLDEWLLPVCSPGWLEARPGLREGPRALQGAWLLHDEDPWAGATAHEEWAGWLAASGVGVPVPEGGRHFNLSQLAVGAAQAGQGVAIGRASLVIDELVAGRLVLPWPPVHGAAVRSRAAYRYVAPVQPAPTVALVREWLVAQAGAFRLQRDEALARLGLLPGPANR